MKEKHEKEIKIACKEESIEKHLSVTLGESFLRFNFLRRIHFVNSKYFTAHWKFIA